MILIFTQCICILNHYVVHLDIYNFIYQLFLNEAGENGGYSLGLTNWSWLWNRFSVLQWGQREIYTGPKGVTVGNS